MSTVNALVLLAPDDPVAATFRAEFEKCPELYAQIDLQFAAADSAAGLISDVEIVTSGVIPAELLELAHSLKWIAYWSAGLDGKITPEIRARNLLLTNASGVHGPNIAEHVMAFMLMFTRRMQVHLRSQIAHVWERRMPFEQPPSAELCGQTLGIVGLGRIGEALAVRARSFGMRVVAVKRDPDSRYDPDASPDLVRGMDGLPDLLGQSDHVCIALPYTPQTHHLFNPETFAMMKHGSYIYNIARGAIVDEQALVAALQNGRIAGAGLDVFEQEPLAQTSELWSMQNVIITPHVAGLTPHYFERFAKLFAQNVHRYIRGERLNNLYEPERGY